MDAVVIAGVVVSRHDPLGRAGMAAQTAWLTVTDAGLVGSVLTPPFQLSEVCAELMAALSLAGFPQLLLLLGHP